MSLRWLPKGLKILQSYLFYGCHMFAVNVSQAAEESAAEAAGRARELYDANKRLEDHIHDLETRKRAPLYQKKQEEELKAAMEKAQEAEIRATEAELKCKEAKVCRRRQSLQNVVRHRV